MSQHVDNTQNKFRAKLEKLLEGAGIQFNGNHPWDIQVYNPEFYERVFTQGSVGLGEAYRDELFNKFCSGELVHRVKLDPYSIKNELWSYFSNRQSKNLASKIIKRHYDIGNELYQPMLGKPWLTLRLLETGQKPR